MDTFDGRLHAAGLRLELHEAPGFELVLTGADGMPPARLEVEEEPRFAVGAPSRAVRARGSQQ